MNKTLIVVLAICLVSVHAMVKRDAPVETKDDTIAKLQEQLNSIAKQAGDKLKETFDAETIKKNFNEAVDNISEAFKKMQNADKKE